MLTSENDVRVGAGKVLTSENDVRMTLRWWRTACVASVQLG